MSTDNVLQTASNKDPRDIILKPVVSEKSYSLIDEGKYTFLVDPRATKTEIKLEAADTGMAVDKPVVAPGDYDEDLSEFEAPAALSEATLLDSPSALYSDVILCSHMTS